MDTTLSLGISCPKKMILIKFLEVTSEKNSEDPNSKKTCMSPVTVTNGKFSELTMFKDIVIMQPNSSELSLENMYCISILMSKQSLSKFVLTLIS